MSLFRFYGIVTVLCLVLFLPDIPFAAGQDLPVTSVENTVETEPVEQFTIKLSVDEVRLDVVVLDNKGRPITDLTAADFEVYQNMLPRDVTSSIYIKNHADTAAAPASLRKGASNLPPLAGMAPNREDVNRTIVFVVDNLSMEPEQLLYTKTSIKRFTERQMAPDDLVAVIRTSQGNSALDFFSSDKRQVASRVDGISSAKPGFVYPDPQPQNPEDEPYANERLRAVTPSIEDALNARIHGNQISTVSYCIRALKDMPGRKILFFMSSMPAIALRAPVILDNYATPESESELMDYNFGNLPENPAEMYDNLSENLPEMYGNLPDDLSEMYGGQLNRLADEALRAGVVIHTLDTRMLTAPTVDARGNEYDYLGRQIGVPGQYNLNGVNGLSYKTGGIFVQDSNFFIDGIGREANNMISGYYLLSYTPPPSTFDVSRRNVFYRVQVKVKRKGAVVYTREGFYGRTENETDSKESELPLQDAVFSSLKHAGLNVNMAAGYIKDAKAGYLVRSWIHLDPVDVMIVETEDGGARVDLETVCMTSDINGFVHDYNHVNYTFDVRPENKYENLAWIQKHGIRFSLLLPVEKPGAYTIRIVVMDKESGKTGSAWQFVEIPDLKKKGLALSDIFMITSADDLKWMFSDATERVSEGLFSPVYQAEEVRSPALRTYASGDSLQTMAILYNADAKAIEASEIEIQFVLYKDGAQYQRGEPVPIDRESAASQNGILILKRFTIGSDMPPGDYVLQIISTDRKNSKKKEGIAAQSLTFTVKEKIK